MLGHNPLVVWGQGWRHRFLQCCVYLISPSGNKCLGFTGGFRLHTHKFFFLSPLSLTVLVKRRWPQMFCTAAGFVRPEPAAAGGIPRKNLQLGSSGSMQTNRVLWCKYWEVTVPAVWSHRAGETRLQSSCAPWWDSFTKPHILYLLALNRPQSFALVFSNRTLITHCKRIMTPLVSETAPYKAFVLMQGHRHRWFFLSV